VVEAVVEVVLVLDGGERWWPCMVVEVELMVVVEVMVVVKEVEVVAVTILFFSFNIVHFFIQKYI